MLFSTSVSSLAWGEENYEDCILENMKGTGSDVAAKAIKDACKAKHINTIFSICVETEAQIINGIIFLPNMNEPFAGNNLCKYINGQVKSKGEIKDGKNDGKWIWWHENGQKGLEKNYKDGKLDGKVTWWYGQIEKNLSTTLYNVTKIDAQIKKLKNYKDGKLDGISTWWHENGQKSQEKNYKDGKPDGKWTYWFEDALVHKEGTFKDGKCISGDCSMFK
mgnify:FL=1